MAQTPTKAVMPERPQQTCPFLQLPVELRVMIYDMALQDVSDDIAEIVSNSKSPQQHQLAQSVPLLGALAILHTSRELRGEAFDALRSLAEVKRERMFKAWTILLSKKEEAPPGECKDEAATESVRARHAVCNARRLCQVLRRLARNRLLSHLSQMRGTLPWSKLEHEQKRQKMLRWYLELAAVDIVCLPMSLVCCDDIEGALVNFVDSGVKSHEAE